MSQTVAKNHLVFQCEVSNARGDVRRVVRHLTSTRDAYAQHLPHHIREQITKIADDLEATSRDIFQLSECAEFHAAGE